RESRRRNILTAEAADEAVIAAAAADRAETHGATVIVFDLEGQLRLEHSAGVIFEAADDGRIDPDAISGVACGCDDRPDILEVTPPDFARSRPRHIACALEHAEDGRDLICGKPSTF